MRDEILTDVKNMIASSFDVSVDTVREETRFKEDLGADSLDVVELIMELEDEFDVEVPDSAAEKIHCVGDVVTYILEQRGSKH